MAQPFEVIAAQFEVWVAPTGEAFTAVDAVPSGNWAKIGTSGRASYTGDGLRVAFEEETADFVPLGESGPVKAWTVEERLRVGFTVSDVTLEQVAHAINNNTVTSAAGPPAIKTLGLYKGPVEKAQRSLLIRFGESPYMASGEAQWEIPVAVQVGVPEIVGRKDEPLGVALEWLVIVDPSASSTDEKFGRLVAQTA
jgi:hypothetical protein